jgi:hypothetical protein
MLFPGLAVVRAPWAFVPFLSLSFWLLSAWWLPGGAPRSSFLGAALSFFVVLSSLRLLKPLSVQLPSGRTLGVLGLALACLAPLALLPVAPGLGVASTEATLLHWRDGFPSTYEPLAPIAAFGAHAPGLPLLAADVSRLSGLAAYRTVLLVSLAGAGLLVVAAYGLFARRERPRPGLYAAGFVAGASVFVPAAVPRGDVLLACAFGLSATAVLVRGSGRAPAVASAFFLAGALTVDAVAGLASLASVALFADPSRRRLALLLGLGLALPRLAELRAFSRAELQVAAEEEVLALVPGGPRGPRSPDVPDPAALRAMAWLGAHTGPLDPICVSPEGPSAFVPAVAARAAVPSQAPAVYRDEAAAGSRRECRYLLSLGRFRPAETLTVPPRTPLVPRGRRVFAEAGVEVFELASPAPAVTSFDKLPGNRASPPP